MSPSTINNSTTAKFMYVCLCARTTQNDFTLAQKIFSPYIVYIYLASVLHKIVYIETKSTHNISVYFPPCSIHAGVPETDDNNEVI